MKGHSGIEYCGWDSDFFQKKIGRIRAVDTVEIKEGLDKAGRTGYDCLFFETAFANQKLVEYCFSHSFILTDLKTTLANPIIPREETRYPPDIATGYSQEVRQQIEDLAVEELAPLSRYAFDPAFGMEKAKNLYREWVSRSINGEFSEVYFLSIPAPGVLAGFITLRLKQESLFVDLFAVNPEFRSREIGSRLIKVAVIWARKNGYKFLYVTTQGHNIPALRTYEKNGFKIGSINLFFHRWL
ncbi:MAG: GNAT family N-acetyltransferase [Candidatus Auribacterota bacterium]|nr:GNAT family N-acetyltransferase [Candidatus Auribacterota bacterium]